MKDEDEEYDHISWVIIYQGWKDDLAEFFAKPVLGGIKKRLGPTSRPNPEEVLEEPDYNFLKDVIFVIRYN